MPRLQERLEVYKGGVVDTRLYRLRYPEHGRDAILGTSEEPRVVSPKEIMVERPDELPEHLRGIPCLEPIPGSVKFLIKIRFSHLDLSEERRDGLSSLVLWTVRRALERLEVVPSTLSVVMPDHAEVHAETIHNLGIAPKAFWFK